MATTTSPSSHAVDAASVTPDDATDLPRAGCIGLSCGVAGDIAVITERGTALTLYVAAGTIFPQGVSRVQLTGTTAQKIVAHYR